MEVVKRFGVSAVQVSLGYIKKGEEYHCTVDLQLSGQADSSPLMVYSKGSAGLGNPAVDFNVTTSMFTARERVLPR